MKIGLLGCGAIGQSIADAILSGKLPNCRLVAVSDAVQSERMRKLAEQHDCAYTAEAGDLPDHGADLIVETASQKALKAYAEGFLARGVSILAMSVGAFADEAFTSRVRELAKANHCYVRVPSGAIGGLDILRAAREGGLESVVLTTRKPPANISPAEATIDLKGITGPVTLFEGPAEVGVRLFPANVNVAASLSLAGIGVQKTVLRLIADPSLDRNVHEVEAFGAFGRLKLELKNFPSPDNPKTSYLACLSAIATLRELSEEDIRVG